MEDKIEVGEFVRTVDGKIGIFDRYSSRKDNSLYKSQFNCFIKLQNRKTSLQCHREYIKNHSKNIIELIKVGDYVNGMLVTEVAKNEKAINICFYNRLYENNLTLFEADIKSIVTKEQFESMKYEVIK